jgi:hypothetical protein
MRALSGFLAEPVALLEPEQVKQRVLRSLVNDQLMAACDWPDERRDALVLAIRERFGTGICAVLIYGSYLRGKRDTVLDFYVLLENYAAMQSRWQAGLAWALPPNVYQVRCGQPSGELRAKCAVMTLGRFEYAMRHDFHSYFWARFLQPSGLLYCRDEQSRERLERAIGQAARSFVQKVVPCLPAEFTAACLVGMVLSLSYRCELRSEPQGHAEQLHNFNADWYQALLAALANDGLGYRPGHRTGEFVHWTGMWGRRRAAAAWWLRRVQGKGLSVLRVLKAALTFSGGFDYLLWKIGRHSGVSIEATPRQRKYPLLFGWPVLWRLYRRGAFR